MLGSLADGITEVHGFLNGADCISSMNCFREMGVTIDHNGDTVIIHGKGLHGLQAPKETLDVGNSGTTTRLMSGILAAQNFKSRVIGDASICRRPMKRIMTPLSLMGADIVSENGHAITWHPLRFTGCFGTSQILYSSCRSVCRRRNQCNRTICIQKSYRADV